VRFHIEHHTEYCFQAPVFLEPHFLRLVPRQDAAQRVIRFDLSITPDPAGRWQGLDPEGNPYLQVWFDGQHDALRIRTSIEAETLRPNPFGYLVMERSVRVPPELDPAEARTLAPCLERVWPLDQGADEAAALARRLAEQANGSSTQFLFALNLWIFSHLTKIVRLEPGLKAPRETLSSGQGACRDAAVLFMDCCRCVGIPARFVSGYFVGDPDALSHGQDLHAWAEVYLSGAGWIGFDPSHGLAVADGHLALVASHDPEAAMPLQGCFRGTGVTATLRHKVHLTLADES